jgi:hypothetical protein
VTWADARLRVLTPAQPRAERRTTVHLHEVLQAARIDADAETVASWDPDELVSRVETPAWFFSRFV